MSRNGTLLPIPDDPRFLQLVDAWRMGYATGIYQWPRSIWLRDFERLLNEFYPQSSSADRKLTARHYAPFYLKDGPNVP